VDLEREKQEISEKLSEIKNQEQQIKRIRENYDQLQKDLDIRRKKLKVEQKQSLLRIQAKETARLEKLISDLRQEEKIEKARMALKALKMERSTEIEAVKNIKIDLSATEQEISGEPIQEGDFVRMREGEASGKVLRLRKGKARVHMGLLTLDVPVEELVRANEPLDINPRRSVQSDVETSDFNSSLDIRGMRKKDADELLQHFFDRALLAGVTFVKIVHGIGSGVLRISVMDKIKEYDEIKSWKHAEDNNGGVGVTYVEF
jgi:DNA mismatch repair protein MutS2